MAKRRKLHGKQLLVVSGIGAASLFGCGDDAVANLVLPPDSGHADGSVSDSGSDMDAETPMDADTPSDATIHDASSLLDAPVANLVLPPDAGEE